MTAAQYMEQDVVMNQCEDEEENKKGAMVLSENE